MARSKDEADRLFGVEPLVKKPTPPVQSAVGAYYRGWSEAFTTRPLQAKAAGVRKAIKEAIGNGATLSTVIDAAYRTGRGGWGAGGFATELSRIEAVRADHEAAQHRARLIQERGF